MNPAEVNNKPGFLKRTIGMDNFIFGFILGMVAPFAGFLFFKMARLQTLTYWEALQYLAVEPSHKILTVALSLSLLANAVLFTIYMNMRIDKTGKGIFAATCLYGLFILVIKTFF